MDTLRWTVNDLDLMPDDGNRYEIIDGELYVSSPVDWVHQAVVGEILVLLHEWSRRTERGVANFAPGIAFDEINAVIPDVVWISRERLKTALQPDGKLHAAPEIAVEILSPGYQNEHRDREFKLKLYSSRGVKEYWIVNWRERTIEIYRRNNAVLTRYKTLDENDTLDTPLLPGFTCKVGDIFTGL
jgi:Uma2 family endonuclease